MNECKKEKRGEGINFFNVDNIKFMKETPDNFYDLAIVDPPYGIMKKTNPVLRKAKMGKCEWDIKPTKRYWDELFRVSKNVFVFGAQYFELPQPKTVVFWDKLNYNPLYGDGELCFYFGKLKDMRTSKRNLGGCIKYTCKNREDKIHPTQKPVQLYQWVIKTFGNPGNKILDTNGGSCTIAIAAHNEKANIDICEIDANYLKKGIQRYDMHRRQLQLF